MALRTKAGIVVVMGVFAAWGHRVNMDLDTVIGIGDGVGDKKRHNQGSGTINAMQWSAHWKCFHSAFFGSTCAPQVEELLTTWLGTYELDFVNLGMFQDPSWTPPSNYGFFDHACSTDNIKVLYDKTKWGLATLEPAMTNAEKTQTTDYEEPSANQMYGCSNKNADGTADRVYSVMPFTSVGSDSKVIVVVGHFPHPEGGTSSAGNSVAEATAPILKNHMAPKIKYIQEHEGWENAKVIFIGDLNNNMDATRPSAFNLAPKIRLAFKKMDKKTVAAVLKMNNQIRGADGAAIEGPVKDALKVAGNQGWVDQPVMSSEDVFAALNDKANATTYSTDSVGTCCADKPAMVKGKVAFPYTFDRIIASSPLETVLPLQAELESAPAKADEYIQKLYVGAFHMPIIGKVSAA